MSNEQSDEITTDKIIKIYIKMRDKRAELKKEWFKKDVEIETQMKVLTQTLLDTMKNAGSDSLKTEFGSVRRTIKTRLTTTDWESMYQFILKHNAPYLLEQRLHQTNLNEFLAQHPDEFPMGVNSSSEFSVTVTRARGG